MLLRREPGAETNRVRPGPEDRWEEESMGMDGRTDAGVFGAGGIYDRWMVKVKDSSPLSACHRASDIWRGI